MEKIKNMLHPGKSKDDEVMYGSGQSGDPVHTGTGSSQPHTPHEPLSSSAAPTASSAREPIGQGGTGSIQQGSTPLSSSRTPDTRDPLDTNKALPREPTTGYSGAHDFSTTSGAGPHSSSMANKADPRVDSDLDGSRGLGGRDTSGMSGGAMGNTLPDRTVGNTGSANETGRSFPLGGASSGTSTAGPHGSNLANKADARVDSDRDGTRGVGNSTGFGSGTGATSASAHQGDLSRTGLGASSDQNTGITTGAATGVPLPRGYGEESWTHDHHKHGHDFAGDPCENEPPAPGAVHFVPGPHSLDTANRLDPHVGGGATGGLEHATVESTSLTGDRQTGSGGLASGAGMGSSGVGAYDTSRDMPITSTTQPSSSGAGMGAYDSNRSMPTTSAAQQPSTTAGPHNSNLLNKADPRVDSDRSKQQGTSTTAGLGSRDTTSTTAPLTGREHHSNRDVGIVGAGAGLGGAAAYGAEKHASHNAPEGTSGSGYSNPYPPASGSTASNLGPASSSVGGPPSSTNGPTSTTAPTSSSGVGMSSREPTGSVLSSTMGPTSSTGPSPSSNLGSSVREPTGTSGLTSTHAEPRSTIDPSTTSRDHNYGRDAGLAGAGAGVGAGAAYEANKHLGRRDDPTTGRSLDPSTTQQPTSGSSRPDYGRDAGVIGTGSSGHHDPRHQPTTSSGLSGQPTSAYNEPSRTGESHTGRNVALGAGAGAEAMAAGEELSSKDIERQQKAAHKEELKEEKAAHKQEVKEEKHHQHEMEKEKAKHEKALAAEHAKEEKHRQHELEKSKKEHEKAVAKEGAKHHKDETHEGEKKHHGLFGFLHRDKPDKELKEDEAARKDGLEHPTTGATGVGVAGAEPGMSELDKHQLAKEHDRNRLHKDPPPGYGDTKYGEEPKSGYASQVTGGTGTTALAQGDPLPQGSHATGLGNKADPNVGGRGDTVDSNRTRDSDGRVIEPTTGLPMDLSKGDGAGGTDGTPVHGYHPGGSNTTGTTGDSSTGGGFGHLQDHSR